MLATSFTTRPFLKLPAVCQSLLSPDVNSVAESIYLRSEQTRRKGLSRKRCENQFSQTGSVHSTTACRRLFYRCRREAGVRTTTLDTPKRFTTQVLSVFNVVGSSRVGTTSRASARTQNLRTKRGEKYSTRSHNDQAALDLHRAVLQALVYAPESVISSATRRRSSAGRGNGFVKP